MLNDGHAPNEPPGKAGLQHLLERLSEHGHLEVTLLDVVLVVVQQRLQGQQVQAKLAALVQEILVGPEGE